MKKPSNPTLMFGLLVAGALLILPACNFPVPASPAEVSPPQAGEQPTGTVGEMVTNLSGLSDQQALLVSEYSWPHSFTVMEYEDESEKPVRFESWNYYDGQIAYIFLDGVFQYEEQVEALPANTVFTPYHPNQFPTGMSPEELIDNLPGDEWVTMQGVDTFQEGMQIYTNQQVMVGFFQERLIFVDAMAYVPGEDEP